MTCTPAGLAKRQRSPGRTPYRLQLHLCCRSQHRKFRMLPFLLPMPQYRGHMAHTLSDPLAETFRGDNPHISHALHSTLSYCCMLRTYWPQAGRMKIAHTVNMKN